MFRDSLQPLSAFRKYFEAQRMSRRSYTRAVKEVLDQAAGGGYLNTTNVKRKLTTKAEQEERKKLPALIDWAMHGFKPADGLVLHSQGELRTVAKTNKLLLILKCLDFIQG